MFRNIFLVTLLMYSVCAVHWEIREVDSAEDQLEEIPDDSVMTQNLPDKCSICKSIIKKVKKKISSKATPDEIKKKLNNTCEKLPVFKSQCKCFIKKYMSTLIDELHTTDGPNTICTKLSLCKSPPPIKEFIFVSDQVFDNL
ncbi:NK-lysin tandem duplicate 2 [Myxocyprinus asiaticus]|uniref:NK-lysin tandem duplicate 2 n=1 Tax=Myxocyprinus asiaticus TaxID=70543 RepID=UPI002222F050|nr:NK-lysin tandem duplicate 2 [Myxocyprinus asiaticus]